MEYSYRGIVRGGRGDPAEVDIGTKAELLKTQVQSFLAIFFPNGLSSK